MTAYLPTILAALVGALSAFADPIQVFIAAHPAVAAAIAAVATIAAHLAKSPLPPKQ